MTAGEEQAKPSLGWTSAERKDGQRVLQIVGWLMPSSASAWAFYIANLGIVAGYLTAAALITRRKIFAGLSWRGWMAGLAFFVLCGLTHFELALHAFMGHRIVNANGGVDWHMNLIHIPQAASIWLFLWAMATEPRRGVAPLEGAAVDDGEES